MENKAKSRTSKAVLEDFEEVVVKKECMGKEVDVIYRKLPARPERGKYSAKAKEEGRLPIFVFDGFGDKPPLNPRTYDVTPDIICEQDILIELEDGTKTYADIYRPKNATNIPCIFAYSWFGKRPCAEEDDLPYQTFGVTVGSYSRHCKFEGPDPEYWCHKGYAVCNYDHRGVGNSEGNIEMFTRSFARDGAFVVEWLAKQPWCNGKIGMTGTSNLAIAQWDIASMNPPHLAAIAPWEGAADPYRELIMFGGFAEKGFSPFLIHSFYGPELMEDQYPNTKLHPYFDEYWQDKVADLEKITVPAYISAGWCHFHLRGALDAFQKVSSKHKWLRIHREFEWEDYYNKENLAELTMFFDRYLKGIRNCWESTPIVRFDVMDAYDCDYQLLRKEETFPLERTEYKKLYLNAKKHSLQETLPVNAASVSYDAKQGHATFDIKFDEDIELTGYMKLHMWVEAEDADDMDLFVTINKLDEDGKVLPITVIGAPHPGSPGRLRVSLRELDEAASTDYRPQQTFRKSEKLSPGEIVPVDIEIWPSSRIWHKGQQLRLELTGFYFREDWFESFDYDTINEGKHIIHTGTEFDSYLQVPCIPPKYKAGNYIYR